MDVTRQCRQGGLSIKFINLVASEKEKVQVAIVFGKDALTSTLTGRSRMAAHELPRLAERQLQVRLSCRKTGAKPSVFTYGSTWSFVTSTLDVLMIEVWYRGTILGDGNAVKVMVGIALFRAMLHIPKGRCILQLVTVNVHKPGPSCRYWLSCFGTINLNRYPVAFQCQS